MSFCDTRVYLILMHAIKEHSMVDKERALDAVRKEYAKNVEIVEVG